MVHVYKIDMDKCIESLLCFQSVMKSAGTKFVILSTGVDL